MNLDDLLSGGSRYVAENKPQNLDMDRISEIVLAMKAEVSEVSDPAEAERLWRARIEKVVDFDALAWQALQVAFQLHGVQTASDLFMLRMSRDHNIAFTQTIQAFYDGFLLAAEFAEKGGHRG